MTEERKQEILEIIRNTNRRPAQTGKPLYPEEIMAIFVKRWKASAAPWMAFPIAWIF